MRYEFKTTLRGETVTVHISTLTSYEDEAPYVEFEVLGDDDEEIELTDEEVDEILDEILEFVEEESANDRAERRDQMRGW
jgi:hypothetical protein